MNFKTRKHFKDSHSHYVDDDLWVIFEDTQDAIIDQKTFALVQKIRSNVTRWLNGWGPAHPLTGLVYCADCGGKLYCHRTDNGKRVDKFTCGNYPSKKCKSGHRIDGNDLLQAVGRTLKAVHDYIQVDNSQFIRTMEESLTSQQTQDVKTQKKRLTECQHRAQELERLLCKIYEDNILGKLPDKRYQMLSNQYERESTALEQEISELSGSIASYTDGTSEAKKFMALINKYQDFENLTAAMLNKLVDKIVVYERDRKGSIQTTQRVDIYFSFIGNFVPPAESVDPKVAAAQEEERRKIEERKDRLHQNYLRRKADGSQQKWEEKYKPIREAKKAKQKAELEATSAKYTRSQFYDMRLVTRTEADMPEGCSDMMPMKWSARRMLRKTRRRQWRYEDYPVSFEDGGLSDNADRDCDPVVRSLHHWILFRGLQCPCWTVPSGGCPVVFDGIVRRSLGSKDDCRWFHCIHDSGRRRMDRDCHHCAEHEDA